VLAVAACLPGLACGGGAASPGSGAPGGGAALAGGLVGANATLRRGLEAWAAADPALRTAPPRAVLAAAARERAIVHRLAGNAALAGTTLPALPASLARAVRTELAAAHALRRLDGPPPKNPAALHLAPPQPTNQLLTDYHLAQTHFNIR
jgi:hypothetical protein